MSFMGEFIIFVLRVLTLVEKYQFYKWRLPLQQEPELRQKQFDYYTK